MVRKKRDKKQNFVTKLFSGSKKDRTILIAGFLIGIFALSFITFTYFSSDEALTGEATSSSKKKCRIYCMDPQDFLDATNYDSVEDVPWNLNFAEEGIQELNKDDGTLVYTTFKTKPKYCTNEYRTHKMKKYCKDFGSEVTINSDMTESSSGWSTEIGDVKIKGVSFLYHGGRDDSGGTWKGLMVCFEWWGNNEYYRASQLEKDGVRCQLID